MLEDLECPACRSTDIEHWTGPNFFCALCGADIELPEDFPVEDWVEE